MPTLRPYCQRSPVVSAFVAITRELYNPGLNPSRTFNIYIYLNHSCQVEYQRIDHLISVMHLANVFDLIAYKPNLLDNDSATNEMATMIHENYKFVITIYQG